MTPIACRALPAGTGLFLPLNRRSLTNNMKFNSVEEIFAANARIRESLLMALEELSNVEVIEKRDSAVWSAANIVEHIAMVEDGSVRICSRLMTKAQADDE